ncbi:MAG: 23S rRNA (uridine(2552)-2'-O)-methyltransferase RlmE [Gammaproteobacteria bacterium]|nr:23S rRNA (uridine(2552)-2'-O)-methyltransferase RlmE [Gammaproteobacteria bacterium]
MVRSKSSKQWLREHFDDEFVRRSHGERYRSRASYKLLEMQDKDRLIRPGMTVVDLGAAPGGWSQVAAELVGDQGRIVASDILPMDSIAGVDFVQGDFTDDLVFERLLSVIGEQGADLVISDIAPNMSGISEIDQPRSLGLAELALELAKTILKPRAYFLVKMFQGAGYPEYHREMQSRFNSVKTRKPTASRARSREVYLLGSGFQP